jgi:mono/diheme cytochrome c family protein
MFWKLHGWIDNVWEKYRVAKGITTDAAKMAKYKMDMTQACNEMDIEEAILKQTPGSGPVLDCPPDVDEKGDFHTKVRPIFESATNHCASCHGPSQSSPYASLTLGGQVSSKCIVERLKRQSNDGGQFKLIEPGDPDKSFLYLKASGKAMDAACVSSDANKPCNTATMPPGGKTLTDAELQILHDWIAAGANYP